MCQELATLVVVTLDRPDESTEVVVRFNLGEVGLKRVATVGVGPVELCKTTRMSGKNNGIGKMRRTADKEALLGFGDERDLGVDLADASRVL